MPEHRARFTARLTTEASISIGETVPLAVNPDRLSYFDPDTGDAIS